MDITRYIIMCNSDNCFESNSGTPECESLVRSSYFISHASFLPVQRFVRICNLCCEQHLVHIHLHVDIISTYAKGRRLDTREAHISSMIYSWNQLKYYHALLQKFITKKRYLVLTLHCRRTFFHISALKIYVESRIFRNTFWF